MLSDRGRGACMSVGVGIPVRVHVVAVLVRRAAVRGGGSGEVYPDVVVRELAHLGVVDAENLGLFGRACPCCNVRTRTPRMMCGRNGRTGDIR